MGWLPYFIDGSQTPNSPNVATWNSQANAWAVDIKSQRKLEELNQTLWMFVSAPWCGRHQLQLRSERWSEAP